MNVKNIHDKFIKQVFSDREAAIEFFSKYLDKEVIDLIDIKSIEYINGSYINEEITELFTDMIFRVMLKGKEEYAFICLLLEHKSAPDPYVILQLLGYLVNGYQTQLKNFDKSKEKIKLQLIIPTLYYHGQTKWSPNSLKDILDNNPKEFIKFIPDFSIIFFDIARQNIEEINKIENLFLKSAISIQNIKTDSKAALVNFFKIKKSFDKYKDDRNYFRIIAVYFYATFSLNKEEIMNLIQENMLSDIEISNDEFISTYDMIMEETAQKYDPIIKEKDRIIAQKDQALVQKDQALELQKVNAVIKAFQKKFKLEEIADLLSISASEVTDILKKKELI